jgi:hypothetical protein
VKIYWRVYFGILLVAISALIYLVHYYEFHNLNFITLYGLSDLAFLPIEVLLVVLVVDWAISEQEKRGQITKLNMVIGIYFSEVGTALLKAFSSFDSNVDRMRDELLVKGTWTTRDFAEASTRLKKHKYNLVYEKGDLKALQFLQNLRSFLISQRAFLLRLLENPNPLEQEAFTEPLWAVFHLADEFYYRPELTSLPNSDYRPSLVMHNGRIASSPLSGSSTWRTS